MQNKKLYRSRDNVMIAGICSGIAKYLVVDPTLVRLVFLLLLFIGAGGLWIYLILWVIMPVEPLTSSSPVVEVQNQPGISPVEPEKSEQPVEAKQEKNVKAIANGQLSIPVETKEKKTPSKKPKIKNVK